MPQGNFSATVDSWVSQTKERMTTVYRESAQRVLEVANTPVGKGGNLPLDVGFLRASLTGGIGDAVVPAKTEPPKDGAVRQFDVGQITLTIAKASIEDRMTFYWTAAYARRMEFGFVGPDSLGRTYNQTGHRFVGLAAQQWPRIVSEVAAEAKRRAGA